jgi:transposase InsO family protein
VAVAAHQVENRLFQVQKTRVTGYGDRISNPVTGTGYGDRISNPQLKPYLRFRPQHGFELPGRDLGSNRGFHILSPLSPWKSFEAVEYKALEWVDWFNHQRLLEAIGNIPPAEAEANHYAALENLKMTA